MPARQDLPSPFCRPLSSAIGADGTRCFLAPFQSAELAAKLHGENSPEHTAALAESDEWDQAIAAILVSTF